jgi:hypothetical protein
VTRDLPARLRALGLDALAVRVDGCALDLVSEAHELLGDIVTELERRTAERDRLRARVSLLEAAR